MTDLNIAIVDDMNAEITVLKKILRKIEKEKYILFDISCFQSGEDFLKSFEKYKFDIVFLDIYMDGISGIETAETIRKEDTRCILIFLTSSIEHMPEAFACHAFEYIQKPIAENRVEKVMTDAIKILPQKTQYIEFNCNRQNVRVLYSDLAAASSDGHYVNISDCSGKVYKTRIKFSEFIALLKSDKRFLQINKGILVNMDYIISIDNNICLLKNNITFPTKIREGVKIKEIWQNYSFEQIRIRQKKRGI